MTEVRGRGQRGLPARGNVETTNRSSVRGESPPLSRHTDAVKIRTSGATGPLTDTGGESGKAERGGSIWPKRISWMQKERTLKRGKGKKIQKKSLEKKKNVECKISKKN